MGYSKSIAIENDRQLMEKVYQHIQETEGKGCGDMECTLCRTYSDILRDEQEVD